MTAVTFKRVSFSYPGGPPAMEDVHLDIEEGELVVVTGTSGSGKSTLLRAVNGLVPHATGGTMDGVVWVHGRAATHSRPREMADLVGFVHQDPEAQFVVDHVERDIAFGVENLGMEPTGMRRRVEEVLDALDIAHLRDRSPATLSGGEKQRCALAGALATTPRVLVLDEPTSQLDPQGAEHLLAALSRLNTELGITVLMAEHRLERVGPIADRMMLMEEGRVTRFGPPRDVLADYPGAPAVTRLGRALDWQPVPLTVKEARSSLSTGSASADGVAVTEEIRSPGETVLSLRDAAVKSAGRQILGPVSVDFHRGEAVAVIGRNGAGKTTLLRAATGLVKLSNGTVGSEVDASYVPQDPNVLFSATTVRRELELTLKMRKRHDPEAIEHWLTTLGLQDLAEKHPRSLSGGERQRVAVATVAVGGAPVLALDEPTRGMDARSRHTLEGAIRDHVDTGGTVLLATHDMELAARVAGRVIVIADGEVIADGSPRSVLSGSLFAPQVLRVFPPYLTVEEATARLGSP